MRRWRPRSHRARAGRRRAWRGPGAGPGRHHRSPAQRTRRPRSRGSRRGRRREDPRGGVARRRRNSSLGCLSRSHKIVEVAREAPPSGVQRAEVRGTDEIDRITSQVVRPARDGDVDLPDGLRGGADEGIGYRQDGDAGVGLRNGRRQAHRSGQQGRGLGQHRECDRAKEHGQRTASMQREGCHFGRSVRRVDASRGRPMPTPGRRPGLYGWGEPR